MLKEKDYGSPVTPIFGKFSIQKDISLVYGEPIDVGKKKIVPVARVNYLIGGGGGNSEGNESLESSQGEGGGGHISIKPLGVYDLTERKTTFKPVYDLRRLTITTALVSGVLVWILNKLK